MFASDATNLVRGDTNRKRDIFLRDVVSSTTRLVSKGVRGSRSNGHSFQPSVSDDGRYVAFLSDATNLVPGDTNRVTDAFRADLRTGQVIRVSTGARGKQANGVTSRLSMSSNGASVAFDSAASNLVPRDTNRAADVFLRDIRARAPKRLSVRPASGSSISPGGRFVGFLMLPAPKGNESPEVADVVGWSRATGRTVIVNDGYEYPQWGYVPSRAYASNAGVSTAGYAYGTELFSEEATVTASPKRLSFGYSWGDADVTAHGLIDISRFGATALVQDDHARPFDYDYELALLDKRGIIAYLGFDGTKAALAGDAKSVAAEKGGQIVEWDRATGKAAVVSVN